MGATTRAGQLTGPLRDRFGILLKLELYSPQELGRIITRSAGILGVPITDEGALELARCARGTPRIANRLLKRARDFAMVESEGTIDEETAIAARKWMDIDELGLDRTRSQPAARHHRDVQRRPGRSRNAGRCIGRGERHAGRHL